MEKITGDNTVAEILEELPNAESIFEDYGVNPLRECGTNIYTIRLKDTPDKCFIDDLDGLISDLNDALESTNE